MGIAVGLWTLCVCFFFISDESVQKDQLGRPEWDKKILPSWKHDDLKSFLADARSHTLEGLGVLDSLEEVLKEWEKPTEEETVFVHSHMSAKKGHEVELMAHVCHLLAKQQGIGKVGRMMRHNSWHEVDLGRDSSNALGENRQFSLQIIFTSCSFNLAIVRYFPSKSAHIFVAYTISDQTALKVTNLEILMQ